MLGDTALSYAIPRIKRMLQEFNMNLGIFAMSVCLTVRLCKKEEYLDYLKEESISASIDGEKYTIS